MPPTVLHKNRKIVRDKSNCGLSRKKCHSSNLWWVVRLTVGYFLFLNSFDATHNDATILQDCFSRYSDEMNTIYEGDILVDRGFRDIVNFLTTNKKLHCLLSRAWSTWYYWSKYLKIYHEMSLSNRTSFWST